MRVEGLKVIAFTVTSKVNQFWKASNEIAFW